MLPQIAVRKYKINLPSVNDKEVYFRPFIVAEHKLLLEVRGLEDSERLYSTVIEIINNCTFNKIDVPNLPVYEIDYLFLNIKAKSSGESVASIFTCVNPECKKQTPIDIDLTQAKIKYPKEFTESALIFIDDEKTSGIRLHPTTFAQTKELSKTAKGTEIFNRLAYSIIECIFTKDAVYLPGKDYTYEELVKFVDELPEKVLISINKYIENLPYVALDLDITCPHCKTRKQIEIKELESFFD
jgi:hypothetical protein